uniref:EOG090X06MA n=1 Tax=Evadne anonyx TaxID=141404 RepID=A0A9N6WQ11_9CRUS|nr:EOG090X06MA [Evadne anonyx]
MMIESCGEPQLTETSQQQQKLKTTESVSSYQSANNTQFNFGNHSSSSNCFPKVTFSSVGSFLNRPAHLGNFEQPAVPASRHEMSRFMKIARQFNCFYFNGDLQFCRPFFIGGKQVGLMRPNVVEVARSHPEVFCVDTVSGTVSIHPQLVTYEERSAKIHSILSKWRDESLFHTLKGWRDECYEVKAGYADPPLLKMERSATCLFGIRQYGVSINGYTKHAKLGFCLWMQQRSRTKQTWPGKWDNIVSGGLSVGHSVFETALKEADEEASIPPQLLTSMKAAGSVSFYFESERGLFPNTEFVYDLELPSDFVPNNADGEVDSFELVPIEEVKNRIVTTDYKTTSCPVALDFLIRHNFINSNNEPHLPELVELLHIPLHIIYNQSR